MIGLLVLHFLKARNGDARMSVSSELKFEQMEIAEMNTPETTTKKMISTNNINKKLYGTNTRRNVKAKVAKVA